MKTESSGKISSFAKYAAGLVLAFCKCADVGWQKSSGKKNKFEMEKGLVFNKSFDLVLSLKNFNFCNLAGSIAYNVPALGAVADFGAQNCQYTTKVDAR